MDDSEQLMGNRPGQLNLRATRQRAAELGALIDELVAMFRFAPHALHWDVLVDKMAVLNVQLQQLQEELRPVCHHYALQPKSVSAQNAGTLPVLLASMLYPEQQALCDAEVRKATNDLERWKAFVHRVCGEVTVGGGRGSRKVARRRGAAGVGASAGAALSAGHASTASTVAPLDDAQRELLNIVSFGGV